MLAVRLPEAELLPLLDARVSIAAINGFLSFVKLDGRGSGT